MRRLERLERLLIGIVAVAVLLSVSPRLRETVASAQTGVANLASQLSGKYLVTREEDETLTGLKTFSRSTNPPFAVNSGAAKVTNLDADKLDGQDFTALSGLCGVRLSLTSGTPVTTSDVTAAATVYAEPYGIGAGVCGMYDGASTWTMITFSETSLALGTLTSALPYDVFAYNNGGTFALDPPVAWTNTTTRATALVQQNGVLVKSGATTRRYLGTFYTTSTTTTEDSLAKRDLWNYYGRRQRPALVQDSTSTWTYTTNTYRQANGATTNQLETVIGVAEDPVSILVNAAEVNSSAAVLVVVAIGEDSTTTPDVKCLVGGQDTAGTSGNDLELIATLVKIPAIGKHTYVWLEKSTATGTTTWRGNASSPWQSGISGTFWN